MNLNPIARCIVLPAILSLSLGSHPASAQTSSGTRVISGVVISSASGQPLEGADVTLNDAKSGALFAEAATDSEGRFAFQHLSDGRFSLRAAHRGYIASAFQEHQGFSTAIITGEGLVSTDLKFPLAPQAVLYGTVADDSGDPVSQARVALYRQNEANGTGNIVRASTVVTDDLGNYEFPRIQPGNYYLAVTGNPWYATHPQPRQNPDGSAPQASQRSPLDVAYATTFYADVTDADSATPIPVKAGDRIPVNFTMHPVPAVHLTLQIPGDGRNPYQNVPQLRQEIFGTTDFVQQSMSFSSHNNGRGDGGMTTVEFGGVPPGHYEVEFHNPRGESNSMSTVDLSSDHQVIDPSAAESLAAVTGKVAMVGGEKLPPGLSISLTSTSGGESHQDHVSMDGSFHIDGLRPGTYEVLARANEAAVAPAQMTASGATADGHLLKVGTAPVTMAATLVESSGSVNGFAKSDGKPAPGVMILLVPSNPGANREMFRRDQSDSDGSFILKRVIPGEYTLVAIEDGWTLDWAHPEVIGHYLAKGQKVTVPRHGRDLDIKEPVEVQPK
jgi:protocatechuate 3,4-dioxygenase beta subunit